jgi:hypothetical protein
MKHLWKLNDYLACILHGLKLHKLADPLPERSQPRDMVALRRIGLPLLGAIVSLVSLNLAADLLSPSPITIVTLGLLSVALLGAVAWIGWLGRRAHDRWGEFRDYQRQVGLVFGIDLEQLMGVEDVWCLGAVFDQNTGVITSSSFSLSPGGTRMQLGNRKFPWDSDLSVANIRAGIALLQGDPTALAQFLIKYGKVVRQEPPAEEEAFPATSRPCLGTAGATDE